MKNNKEIFIFGLIVGLLSYISVLMPNTNIPNYSELLARAFSGFNNLNAGWLTWVYEAIPLGAAIIFILFCGLVAYLLAKVFEKFNKTRELPDVLVDQPNYKAVIKSNKLIILGVFILLSIYPIQAYMYGFNKPIYHCSGDYNLDTLDGCTRSFEENSMALKLNLIYLAIFLFAFLFLLKNFSRGFALLATAVFMVIIFNIFIHPIFTESKNQTTSVKIG